MSDETGGGGHRFDAYVSHAEGDREWVEDVLVPRLEAAGRRLCLDSDLVPGGIELVERTAAISASRKTILVLSPDFLASSWGPLDEAVARELDPAARKRKLIPLLHSDCEMPLRVRPLVAVDLRRTDDDRQWRRLLQAVDPEAETRPGLGQRLSLRLAEVTADLVAPPWSLLGAALLLVTYLSLTAGLALLVLLLREMPALSLLVNGLLVAPLAALATLGRHEDADFFRRLSHVAARSRRVQAALGLWLVALTGLWAGVGVDELREYRCGIWGCKQAGQLYLAIDRFAAPSSGDAALSLRTGLEQKLANVAGVQVLGQGLARVDPQALRELDVDHTLVGEMTGGSLPVLAVSFYDRHMAAEPPPVAIEGVAADLDGEGMAGYQRRQELMDRLARAILERLGVALAPRDEERLAHTPTDQPRAAELNQRGYELMRQGRLAEAESELAGALALDDRFGVAWSNRAEVAWRSGHADLALAYRRHAVDSLPGYAPFHYNLGHLLAALGRSEQAKDELRRAIELDRAHAPSFNELGRVELDLGEPRRAAEALREGMRLDPSSPALAKNLGRALLAAGDPKGAVSALEGSLDLYPQADWLGRVEAHSLLVAALNRLGEGGEACRHLDAVKRLDPDAIAPWTPAALAAGRACPGGGQETPHV